MAKYKDEQLQRGAASLREHIESLLEDNRELSDFHDAFEQYGAKKFALGSSALTVRVSGKNQKGIDFYSQRGGRYHIGQCKMPDLEWVETHPNEIRVFGPQGVDDLREALQYLFGETPTASSVNET